MASKTERLRRAAPLPSAAPERIIERVPCSAPNTLTLRLATHGLEATLPNGHRVPLPEGPKALDRLYHLLMRLNETEADAQRNARLGEGAAPTIAYLEHYERHVAVTVPRIAPGCPFCAAAPATRVPPQGTAARLEREAAERERRRPITESEAEDLGL